MQNYESTILSQFANSPTLMQLISNWNGYIDPSANIDLWYNNLWNINTAIGYGLDVWGRILGVSRTLQLSVGSNLGFENANNLEASGDPFNLSPFYNGQATTSNYNLSDAAYRILLLAKAAFNITNCAIPAINQVLIDLFGPNGLSPVAGNSYCTDTGNMTMTYTFGSTLSPLQQSIVFQSGVLPRPAGVLATVVQL